MRRFLTSLLLALVAICANAAAQGQAVLRPGDIFELRLSGMPLEYANEFTLQYTVDDTGTVHIPYIGALRAGGVPTSQFARTIEKELVTRKIFTSPTVLVTLQPQSRFVTVGGGVRSPQAVPWSQDLSLSVALKRCGGVSDFGDPSKIKITREGKSQMYNLRKAEKDPSQNPKLLPGDEVEVRE